MITRFKIGVPIGQGNIRTVDLAMPRSKITFQIAYICPMQQPAGWSIPTCANARRPHRLDVQHAAAEVDIQRPSVLLHRHFSTYNSSISMIMIKCSPPRWESPRAFKISIETRRVSTFCISSSPSSASPDDDPEEEESHLIMLKR